MTIIEKMYKSTVVDIKICSSNSLVRRKLQFSASYEIKNFLQTSPYFEHARWGLNFYLSRPNLKRGEGVSPYATVNYTYDDLNRLTGATATNVAAGTSTYSHTFTYDSIGNLTNKSDLGSYSYAGTNNANPHAATTINSVTNTYDDNGNLTADGTRTVTWNYRNLPATVVKSSVTNTYTYDHEGDRVITADGTTTRIYPSDLYNKAGSTTVKHIYANGELIATVDYNGSTTTVYHDHTDHLTGTGTITSSTPAEIQTLDYFAFGEQRINDKAGTFDEQIEYAGSEYDGNTSLNYMNARYYNGNQGRFISEDPVFINLNESKLKQFLNDPQAQNSYSYSRNNPMRYIDPSGEWWKEFIYDNVRTLGNGQSWVGFQAELGQATQYMTDNNAVWDYAVSNPKTAGALVGVLAAPATEAGLSAIVAAKAAGATGVGVTYAAKQATAAAVYTVVAGTSLQAIPHTLKVLGAQDTSNQSRYASVTYNVASQVVPTIIGGYVGAVSDVLQFSKTVADKFTSSIKSH